MLGDNPHNALTRLGLEGEKLSKLYDDHSASPHVGHTDNPQINQTDPIGQIYQIYQIDQIDYLDPSLLLL